LSDHRITADGVVVIKAQEHRTQETNRLAALQRLAELLESTARAPRKRVATKPTLGSKRRRLEGKSQQSQRKAQRAKVVD
jgi:ribosome-associated protein